MRNHTPSAPCPGSGTWDSSIPSVHALILSVLQRSRVSSPPSCFPGREFLILDALASSSISPKRAGTLLYGLQLAQKSIGRPINVPH